jgi:PPP family 3-phenylpropionic acid transporter
MGNPLAQQSSSDAGHTAGLGAARAIYFFYFAAGSTIIPYLSIYYQELGLPGGQIGILIGITPVVALFAAPAWSALADASGRHRTILLFAMGLSGLAYWSLGIPQTFAALALVVALAASVTAPIIPLVDNSVVEQLGARRDAYGKQRVWGSYGWGVAGLFSGWLVGRLGLSVIFYSYPILMGLGLLMARHFPVSPAAIGVKLGSGAQALFSQRRWLLFLAVVWAAGASLAMFNNFLFIFLRNIGTSDALLGMALALGIISEIPFFFYSDRLLRRFGATGLLLIGAGFIFGRTLALSLVASPWQALALQLMVGPTFALIWVAGVEYASRIAPPGLGATAQGVFQGVFVGLGFASGSVLGGLLLQNYGIRVMFQAAAMIIFLAGLLFWLVNRLRR